MALAARLGPMILSCSLYGCVAGQRSQPQRSDWAADPTTTARQLPAPTTTAQTAPDQHGSVALGGYWIGTSTAFCNLNPAELDMRCNAMNIISLSLFDEEHGVKGFYKCSFGNRDCRDQNDTGKVAAGWMHGRRLLLRIGLPDLSSCLFEGLAQTPVLVHGDYFCYQGGGLIEQGQFEIRRRL